LIKKLTIGEGSPRCGRARSILAFPFRTFGIPQGERLTVNRGVPQQARTGGYLFFIECWWLLLMSREEWPLIILFVFLQTNQDFCTFKRYLNIYHTRETRNNWISIIFNIIVVIIFRSKFNLKIKLIIRSKTNTY